MPDRIAFGRLYRIATPFIVPIAAIAATCGGDNNQQSPPQYEDGIHTAVGELNTPVSTLTRPPAEESLISTPVVETNPTTKPSVSINPNEVQPQREFQGLRNTEQGCMQTVVERTDTAVYTYDIFCAPYPIDPVLGELPLKFLQGRLPQSDYQQVHSLLLEIQEGAQDSGEKTVQVQRILNINCVRDTKDRAIDAISRGIMSYAIHNHPEVFDQNRDVFFADCYMGEKVTLNDQETAQGEVSPLHTYVKKLNDGKITLYSDMTFDELLTDENTALLREMPVSDWALIRSEIIEAKKIYNNNPIEERKGTHLHNAAAKIRLWCLKYPNVKEYGRKFLSLVEELYGQYWDNFSMYARECKLVDGASQ